MLTVGFLVACSAIFPYSNEFACSGGSNISYCNSATDIYNKIESGEIKTAQNKQNKTNEKTTTNDLIQENHDLKMLLKATQAEKLRSDRKYIILEGDYLNNYEKNKMEKK